jgi:5'(3')-deoxyribonucleotidase
MRELEGLLRDGRSTEIRVSLDIEGVLADISTPVINLYNEIHGTNWKVDDIKDWEFKSINADVHEMMALFNRVWIERDQEIGFEGDTALAGKLAVIKGLEIVTSRTGVDSQLGFFLERNGLGEVPLVINPPTKEKTELQYSVYIDDSPVLAEEIAKTEGKILILVDRPWNRDVPKSDRMIRVADVNEAVSLLIRCMERGDSRRIKRRTSF